MTNPIVIDLSHHNDEPDWETLLVSGTLGVILKASEGTTYVDPTFYDRAQNALLYGLKVASYHFLKHGWIDEQMSWYMTAADRIMPLGSRVVLDFEDPDCTLDDLEQAVGWLIGHRPDLQIAVYSGHLIKQEVGGDDNELLKANTSLWIAQYTSAAAPDWPRQVWPAWSLWQYTDAAKATGCSQPVDGNRWNGTPENLLKWFGPVEEPPVPVADVEIKTVTGLRIVINGTAFDT